MINAEIHLTRITRCGSGSNTIPAMAFEGTNKQFLFGNVLYSCWVLIRFSLVLDKNGGS